MNKIMVTVVTDHFTTCVKCDMKIMQGKCSWRSKISNESMMEGDKDACRSCCKKKPEEALKITAEQKIATVTLIPLQKIHKKRDTA